MSKYANPGELRTPVLFMRVNREEDKDGFSAEVEECVFGNDALGNPVPIYCKWVNVHGYEVWQAKELQLNDPATITARYSPLLDDETLIVYKQGDERPYEVVSIDNVEQRDVWLEIKVQRKVAAR